MTTSIRQRLDEQFSDYVSARHTALLRSTYVLTGNRADAEDLLQAALAKTYLAWPRIRDRQAVDAYVRRVMFNAQRSASRRQRVREVLTGRVPEPPEAPTPAEPASRHDWLWAELGRLPRRQRSLLALRYYEDLSEKETAQILGISVGTVKSSTSRALARLRAGMTPAVVGELR